MKKSTRRRPVVLSTRTTRAERTMIELIAEAEDVSLAEVVHRLLIPAAEGRLAQMHNEGHS